MSCVLFWIGVALADDAGARAAEKAVAALERHGPHVARYARVRDGEPAEVVLEVVYHGPSEIALRAQSSETEATMSVDETHARIRVSGQCAVVEMAPLLQAVEDTGIAPAEGSEAPALSTQLDYRLTPSGEASMDIRFQRSALPAPLGWLAAMADEDAAVVREGRSWRVEQRGVSWWVSRRTGVLERMAVGDGQLYDMVQVEVVPLEEGASTEAERCPQSSDGLTTAMFTSQLLWEAYSSALPSILPAWQAQPDDARAETVSRQHDFWRHYFHAEMKTWEASLQATPTWRGQVIQGMQDVRAYDAFQAQLPPSEQPNAMRAWQEAWFANAGRAMVSDHVDDTEKMLYTRLLAADAQIIDPELFNAFVLEPMSAEAMAAGEVVLLPILGPVVEQGAARLQVILDGR